MEFTVTFEVITQESASHGDAERHGWILRPGDDATLREAVESLQAYGRHVEADSYPISIENPPRWFTAYETNEGTCDYYETGDVENRSLHIRGVTPSSAMRLARLLKCYGVS